MTTPEAIARIPDDFVEQFRERCEHHFMPVLNVDTGGIQEGVCLTCGMVRTGDLANVVLAVEAAGRGGA